MPSEKSSTHDSRFSILTRSLAASLIMLTLPACAKTEIVSGNIISNEKLALIKPDESTKTEVEAALGSPLSRSSFGDEKWYYVYTKSERIAFLEPKIIDRKVVEVGFDESGLVKNVSTYGKEDAKKLAFVEKSTPTKGNRYGLVEQLVGNVGKFNRTPEEAP